MLKENSSEYFIVLDNLIKKNGINIDRPRGTSHPRYPELVYPINYGYIDNTKSQDGQGIDVFVGDDKGAGIVGIICTIDIVKNDSEIKVLYDCTKKT